MTREEALAAELRIKGWSRAKKEAMMGGDWAGVNLLGRGKHRHQRVEAAKPMTVLRAEMSSAETAEDLVRLERDLHE